MSKFSDLIQKKHEMLKVTMKVDPAACKNGEITHFREYVGFVLAEKEFEKTYEKLLKKYTLQNEGFFDAVGGALRAVGRRLKDDIVKPFKDAKYNPFVGYGDKELPKTEADSIVNEILNNWLCDNINKKLSFIDDKGNIYQSISLNQFPGQTCVPKETKVSQKEKTNKQNTSETEQKQSQQSKSTQVSNTQETQQQSRPQQQKTQKSGQQVQQTKQQTKQASIQQNKPQSSLDQQQTQVEAPSYGIGSLILFTDFNNQLNINSIKSYFVENGNKIITERKKQSADYRKKPVEIKIDDVIKHLEYVAKNNLSRKQGVRSNSKYTWIYMLAKDGQQLKVTNPKDGA